MTTRIGTRLSKALSIDASLRRSRSVFTTLAILLVPAAFIRVIGLLMVLSLFLEGGAQFSLGLVLAMVFDTVLIVLAVVIVRCIRESQRRLQQLQKNPHTNVRPMPVSDLMTVFGPHW